MQTNFKFCPKCSSENNSINKNHFICKTCNFEYFHNVAGAVAVLLRFEDEILFTVRNINPQKGFLDLPGGFVDQFESSEQTVKRELFEELKLDLSDSYIKYLGSNHNRYLYKDVLYHTLDLFYEVKLIEKPIFQLEKSEITSILWINKNEIPIEKIAFESQKIFFEKYF